MYPLSMNNVHARGVIPGTCSLEKRRLPFLLVLIFSFLCFNTADIFLPNVVMAADAAASAKSSSTTVAKKNIPKKSTQKKSAKKTRRAISVRSLAPEAERASLRERGISSGFGLRAISRTKTRMHKGIDIPAPKGSKVLAYNDGEVIFTGVKNGYGKTVIIRQIDEREALYAHMSGYVVSIGDQIKRGSHVGHVGRTGRATGYHLHFEIIDEGNNLDPAQHVWHGSELVLGPDDLNPDAPGQTQMASPDIHLNIPPLH